MRKLGKIRLVDDVDAFIAEQRLDPDALCCRTELGAACVQSAAACCSKSSSLGLTKLRDTLRPKLEEIRTQGERARRQLREQAEKI